MMLDHYITAEDIKEYRLRQGFSQPAMAKSLDISLRKYRDIELGVRPLEVIEQLAFHALMLCAESPAKTGQPVVDAISAYCHLDAAARVSIQARITLHDAVEILKKCYYSNQPRRNRRETNGDKRESQENA
jgi:DNA-binding XRE family transcriptional regulator